MIKITLTDENLNLTDYLDELRSFLQEKPDLLLTLAEAILVLVQELDVPQLQDFDVFNGQKESWMIYFKQLGLMLKMLNKHSVKEDRFISVLKKVLCFIIDQDERRLNVAKSLLLEIMRKIHEEGKPFERFISSDVLITTFLEGFFYTPPLQSILIIFFNQIYEKSESDPKYFQIYGTIIFDKIKAFLVYVQKTLSKAALPKLVHHQKSGILDSVSALEENFQENDSTSSCIAVSSEKLIGFKNMLRMIYAFLCKLIIHEPSIDFSIYFRDPDPAQIYDFREFIAKQVIYLNMVCLIFSITSTLESYSCLASVNYKLFYCQLELPYAFAFSDTLIYFKFIEIVDLTKIYCEFRNTLRTL